MNTINTNLGQRIKKDVFCLVVNMGQKKNSESLWGIKPQASWGRRIFLCPTLAMRRKTSFFISLTSSKFIISLFLFTNMMLLTLLTLQDLFHKNFIIDLAHHRLRGSMVEYRNSESKGLRFNSWWGLRIFSLFHACEKMKPFSISLLNNKFTISIIPFTN